MCQLDNRLPSTPFCAELWVKQIPQPCELIDTCMPGHNATFLGQHYQLRNNYQQTLEIILVNKYKKYLVDVELGMDWRQVTAACCSGKLTCRILWLTGSTACKKIIREKKINQHLDLQLLLNSSGPHKTWHPIAVSEILIHQGTLRPAGIQMINSAREKSPITVSTY